MCFGGRGFSRDIPERATWALAPEEKLLAVYGKP